MTRPEALASLATIVLRYQGQHTTASLIARAVKECALLINANASDQLIARHDIEARLIPVQYRMTERGFNTALAKLAPANP